MEAHKGKLYRTGIRGSAAPRYLGQCERGGATWCVYPDLAPIPKPRMSMLVRSWIIAATLVLPCSVRP